MGEAKEMQIPADVWLEIVRTAALTGQLPKEWPQGKQATEWRSVVEMLPALRRCAGLPAGEKGPQQMPVNEQLGHMETLDPLTNVPNRRLFLARAEALFVQAQQYQLPLALFVLDIDYFKLVNDTLGHAVGDQVLYEVAQLCLGNLRAVDLFGRIGGEEFAAILPQTPMEGARVVAERLRRSIADHIFASEHNQAPVTVSLGVAEIDKECSSLVILLERAELALLAAKHGGRNQVVVAG